jgi:arylformamidase
MTKPAHPYDNRGSVDDCDAYFDDWRARSALVYDDPTVVRGIRYGDGEREAFDLMPGEAPNGDVLVFIHGGYWQWYSRDVFAFIAPAWRERGVHVVNLGYPLAPGASVSTMVAGVTRALMGLRAALAPHVGAVRTVVVSGWSAGGHLAMSAGAQADAVIALSGLYDLRPLIGTSLNEALALTQASAEAVSPALWATSSPGPVMLGVGGSELPALQGQSRTMHDRRVALGLPVCLASWAALHHYSVLDSFSKPGTPVFDDAYRFYTTCTSR